MMFLHSFEVRNNGEGPDQNVTTKRGQVQILVFVIQTRIISHKESHNDNAVLRLLESTSVTTFMRQSLAQFWGI